MARLIRTVRKRRRRVLAVVLTALALAAAGYAVSVGVTWSSCRDFKVRSYPAAYPQCHAATQSSRPKIMAGAAGLFLVLAVGAAYLWVEETRPLPRG
jgi:hypothetical protein